MQKNSKRTLLNEKTKSYLDTVKTSKKFLGITIKTSIKKRYMRLAKFSKDESIDRAILGFHHKKISLKNGFFTYEQIRFGKIILYSRQTTQKSVFRTFLGIKLAKQDRVKILLKKYSKYALRPREGQKSLIVFVNTNSGEYFSFLRFIYINYLLKNNYAPPHFIFNQRYCENVNLVFGLKDFHYDKNYLLDVPCRFVSTPSIDFLLIFDFEYYLRTDFAMKQGGHYLTSMQAWLSVQEMSERLLEWEKKESLISGVKEEAKLLGLDLENFIFLAPKANSMREKDALFDEILSFAKENEIDVYVNLAPGDLFTSSYPYKNSALSMEGALYLASHAKAVIGLRSGFLELLTLSKVPIFALYTQLFRDDISSCEVREGYSLKKFPGINQDLVFEYDFTNTSDDEVKESIIKELVKLK